MKQTEKKICLAFYLHMFQDINMLRPLIIKAKQDKCIDVKVYIYEVNTVYYKQIFADFSQKLEKNNIAYEYIRENYTLNNGSYEHVLEGYDALVTSLESSSINHYKSYGLTLEARELGLITYQIQHGLEITGLTIAIHARKEKMYLDPVTKNAILNKDIIHFGSDYIFTWEELNDTWSHIPNAKTLQKIRQIGITSEVKHKKIKLPDILKEYKSVIGIFDNIMCSLYTQEYREKFLQECLDIAKKVPECYFLYFCHPSYIDNDFYTDFKEDCEKIANIIFVNRKDDFWAKQNTNTLASSMDAIIANPSSSVIDAARSNTPIAVPNPELRVIHSRDYSELYSPLTILVTFEDWIEFIHDSTSSPEKLYKKSTDFLEKFVADKPAVDKALEYIKIDYATKNSS